MSAQQLTAYKHGMPHFTSKDFGFYNGCHTTLVIRHKNAIVTKDNSLTVYKGKWCVVVTCLPIS